MGHIFQLLLEFRYFFVMRPRRTSPTPFFEIRLRVAGVPVVWWVGWFWIAVDWMWRASV